MLSVEQALECILTSINTCTGKQILSVEQCHGRVLANNYQALHTHPAYNISAMDGYALTPKTYQQQANAQYGPVRIVGTAQAGKNFNTDLNENEAVRIFTGAILPQACDRILIQENATIIGEDLYFDTLPSAHEYVRQKGIDFQKNAPLFKQGKHLNARDINLLLSMNHAWVSVYKKPRVYIINTGDELVLSGHYNSDTSTHQNKTHAIASSGFAIAAALNGCGAEASVSPLCVDQIADLKQRLSDGANYDLIVTTGGASVGDYDIVAQALKENILKLKFDRVRMRPGKPLSFSFFGNTPVISLPGNPVSSIVGCFLFLLPALVQLSGRVSSPSFLYPRLAKLAEPLEPNGERQSYLRAQILQRNPDNTFTIQAFQGQDSAQSRILQKADGLIVRLPNALGIDAQAEVPFFVFPDFF